MSTEREAAKAAVARLLSQLCALLREVGQVV